MLVAYAKKPLVPGTRLSLNYADAEVLTWDVKRRREHLKESYGFVCGCERCEREAAEEGEEPPVCKPVAKDAGPVPTEAAKAPLRAQNTVGELVVVEEEELQRNVSDDFSHNPSEHCGSAWLAAQEKGAVAGSSWRMVVAAAGWLAIAAVGVAVVRRARR